MINGNEKQYEIFKRGIDIKRKKLVLFEFLMVLTIVISVTIEYFYARGLIHLENNNIIVTTLTFGIVCLFSGLLGHRNLKMREKNEISIGKDIFKIISLQKEYKFRYPDIKRVLIYKSHFKIIINRSNRHTIKKEDFEEYNDILDTLKSKISDESKILILKRRPILEYPYYSL